jgi:hypothetical protein
MTISKGRTILALLDANILIYSTPTKKKMSTTKRLRPSENRDGAEKLRFV